MAKAVYCSIREISSGGPSWPVRLIIYIPGGTAGAGDSRCPLQELSPPEGGSGQQLRLLSAVFLCDIISRYKNVLGSFYG